MPLHIRYLQMMSIVCWKHESPLCSRNIAHYFVTIPQYGNTPLHLAVEHGYEHIFQILLQEENKGMDVISQLVSHAWSQ